MTGRLLTGREVADMLGVSNKTVLRWALEGELPSIRLSNRAIRFREDELDRWLESRAAPARAGVNDPSGHRPDGRLVGVNDPRSHAWPEH